MISKVETVSFLSQYGATLLQLILTEEEWYIENNDEYSRNILVSLEDLVTLKNDLEDWIEQKKKEGY